MKAHVLIVLLIVFLTGISIKADEGMWPLSELDKLNLTDAGFEIGARQIFNPDGSVSLIDAIINLNGCSASFISTNGLILTNHHCAFGAVQEASSSAHDYLRNGLVTCKLDDEIPAKGMTVKITESYRDVSKEVLKAVKKGMSPLARTKAIEKKIKEMEIAAEKSNKGKRAEVAEMFQGKVYVLFLFTYLKDVRLVYVPPRYIGEFGGESDNWVWPRHTGDFTILRAYVGPNGESAGYAKENIPYTPKKFLKIAPQGISEGDLMFILGFPGRTYRHQPASFLHYEEEIRMPAVVRLYQWLIQTMDKASEEERDVQLKLASRIKGLANRMKNFQGKLKGLNNLKLTEKRKQEEDQLLSVISDTKLKNEFLTIQKNMSQVYDEMGLVYPTHHFVTSVHSNWSVLSAALSLVQYAHERNKKDEDRESPYMTRNLEKTRERLIRSVKNIHIPVDEKIAEYILMTLGAEIQPERLPLSIRELCSADSSERKKMISAYYDKQFLNEESFGKMFDEIQLNDLKKSELPAIKLALDIYPLTQQIKDSDDKWKGRLDTSMARWIDIKQQIQKGHFLPDANGTFRLTWGRIKGYSPRDAVVMKPFTILEGLLEKAQLGGDYKMEDEFRSLVKQAKNSKFFQDKIAGVPVNILYDADTTGGNSGSPVLNSRGELVGLNFDRAFEATINDYAWDEGYSRSIGVDIRFILWYIESTGASELLSEMTCSQ